ncbi:hypothetical protein FRC06_003604 [Ceratobasidium sp. 370]|nr:hypothetical protein FRC06_003604 [Ceratobasidium sp. 370]
MVLWPHACSLAALLLAYAPSINAAALSVRDTLSGPDLASNGLVVDTASGKVQGFFNDTAKDVRAFLGVPFAAAPTGSLRFMPPAVRPRSSSTIQATSWPPACPGLYPNITSIYTILPYIPFTRQDEDCLTMNVWTPSASRLKKNGNKLLPVLVYIYGGAFDQGGTSISTYEGTDLVANHDIFKCMQHVPFQTFTDFINNHPEKGYLFRLVVDNITVFTDVPERIASGRLAKLPQFMGSLDNEGDSLVPFSYDGINQTAADEFGQSVLLCPGSREAKLRIDAGLLTWRYRYSGIYPNLNPFSFIRTYHTSDVPMWLGSINVVPGLASATTADQKKQSAYMQGALVAFGSDPKQGLTKYGWPVYKASVGKTLVHLDPRNSSKVVVFENPAEFDAPCGST